MELIKYTSEWVKGEIFQGKIMLIIAILFLFASIAILKSNHEILRGTLIPLGVIILLLLGYGGFQTFGRQSYMTKVTTVYKESPEKTIKQEYDKALKDGKIYKILKIVWTILIVISVIVYFVFSKDYFKGFAIGLIELFLITLIVDSMLHYRLEIYLKGITEIITK